jgi:hypothetical protein
MMRNTSSKVPAAFGEAQGLKPVCFLTLNGTAEAVP